MSRILRSKLKSVCLAAATRTTSGKTPRKGTPLPPKLLRQGGIHFRSNADFLRGGIRDVTRLLEHNQLDIGSRVVDLGCGAGRLAIGILEMEVPIKSYIGLEVQSRHVQWGNRFLANRDPRLAFVHIDSANDRYNPGGRTLRWPFADGAADLIYAYSVFSHMRGEEASFHLREAARVGKTIALTGFFERNCPTEQENPSLYGSEWTGPLHCVRYEIEHFIGLGEAAGFRLQSFDHRSDTDGQSFLLLTKR